MTVNKKFDNSYRIILPAEMLAKLELKTGDEVELKLQDNKIIIANPENVSEVKSEPPVVESRLDNIISLISKEDTKVPAVEEGEPIRLNRKYRLETRCHQCLSDLGESKFKLNGGFICRSCRDALRDQLIFDIANKNY